MNTKSNKKKSYVFKTPKMHIDYNQNIRISESDNEFKKIVAREISNYMGATSRQWDVSHRADVNTRLLIKHLNDKFSEFNNGSEFRALPSQSPFDAVCLGCNVVIEVKSVKGNNPSRIITNATIYPDKVSAVNALPKKFAYPTQDMFLDPETLTFGVLDGDQLETKLDVLVVCVNHLNEKVVGYSIVDGNYWGVNEALYLACKQYYHEVNDDINQINERLAPRNIYAQALVDGYFGDAIVMELRKLIKMTNPTGRLNVHGRWGFVKI